MKDIVAIEQHLSQVRLPTGRHFFWYSVGDFAIWIHPCRSDGFGSFCETDRITQYEKVDIALYENRRQEDGYLCLEGVDLEYDIRFAHYQPIKYSHEVLSTGTDMPVTHLCQLIKYLHRLCHLTAFM